MKLQNIGMVDAQNSHIGTAPLAPLLDGLGGGIEHRGKGERSRRNTLGGLDRGILGPQPGEGIACAAAGFVDQRAIADRRENTVHRIVDRQDKAGGELTEIGAGIHQTG